MLKIDLSAILKLWPWYLLAAVIVVLDQYTKALAVANIQYAELIEVLPVFDLTLLHNYGAAWSLFDEKGGSQRWFLTGISFFVSLVLVLYWIPAQKRTFAVLALTLILGGALGNLYDRAVFGYVVDFIAVHYQQHRFPAFNIADSAISIGAVLLFIELFIFEPNAQRKADKLAGSADK